MRLGNANGRLQTSRFLRDTGCGPLNENAYKYVLIVLFTSKYGICISIIQIYFKGEFEWYFCLFSAVF